MNKNKVSHLLKALLVSAVVFIAPVNSANAFLAQALTPTPAPVVTPAPAPTPAPVAAPVPAAPGAGLAHHDLTDVHDRSFGAGLKEGHRYDNDRGD